MHHDPALDRVVRVSEFGHARDSAAHHDSASPTRRAEDERLAVLEVQGVVASTLAILDILPDPIVEDRAVLQNLDEGSSLVGVCLSQNGS